MRDAKRLANFHLGGFPHVPREGGGRTVIVPPNADRSTFRVSQYFDNTPTDDGGIRVHLPEVF